MFDYDPAIDNLLPCQDIGLSFRRGDVLEVRNFSRFYFRFSSSVANVSSKNRPACIVASS